MNELCPAPCDLALGGEGAREGKGHPIHKEIAGMPYFDRAVEPCVVLPSVWTDISATTNLPTGSC